MNRNKSRSALWAGLGILLLIFDGKTALTGAREGIELCLTAVIPALFPFMVLTPFLVSAPLLRPLGRLCHVPRGAEQLLIPAFLGGYPLGARSVADAYRAGQLEKDCAQRMLAFCNNAGPSFLFGMIAPLFPEKGTAWLLWAIHLLSAIPAALLFSPEQSRISAVPIQTPSVTEALKNALGVMASVCGWVVIFRVVIEFLKRWVFFLLPTALQVALTGLLELANGCCALPLVESIPLRFTICSVLLALGGLCVTMQTMAVTAGLSLRFYFPGKLLQGLFSLLLCGCLFRRTVCFVITPILCFAVARKKRAGIPSVVGI